MISEAHYKTFFTPILEKIDVAIIAPCAGVCYGGYMADMDSVAMKDLINVNLIHPILMSTSVALPYFEKRGAGTRNCIVFPSSTLDEQESSPGFALYGATKLGLSQFA